LNRGQYSVSDLSCKKCPNFLHSRFWRHYVGDGHGIGFEFGFKESDGRIFFGLGIKLFKRIWTGYGFKIKLVSFGSLKGN